MITCSSRLENLSQQCIMKDRLAELALNYLPLAVICVDDNFNIQFINEKAKQWTGQKGNALLSQPISQALHPFSEKLQDSFEQVSRSNTLQRCLDQKLTTGQKVTCYDALIKPIEFEGKKSYLVMLEKNQRRKAIENLAIEHEKMTTLAGLAAGMAHEINNPLGIITQSAQNIERRLLPTLEKNQAIANEHQIDLEALLGYLEARQIPDFLTHIQQGAKRAAEVARQTLALKHAPEKAFQKTRVKDIIDNALYLTSKDYDLNKTVRFSETEIVIQLEDPELSMLCNVTQLEQVFINLLKNAAYATHEKHYKDEKPKIIISSKRIGEWLFLQVEDNGCGMSQEVVENLFKPFYTSKKQSIGTGLGLFICHSIICHHHQGDITAASVPEEGSTITITLPIQ